MRAILLSCLLVAGCSSNAAWRINAGTPNPGAQVQVHAHTGSDLAVFLGLAILAGGAHDATRGEVGYLEASSRRPPEMAPDRRISEQDCTRPLDYSLGNIRCK